MSKPVILRPAPDRLKEADYNRQFDRRYRAWRRFRKMAHLATSPQHIVGRILGRFGVLADSVEALRKNACETQIRELLRAPRYANPLRLEHFALKVFSEHGEDGVLQEIFRRIGTTNKYFVEFGVANGLECNTHLLLYLGWRGLWIEGNEDSAAKIRGVFTEPLEQGSLKLEQSFIMVENINEIIARGQTTGEIDLLSVDIDGNDLHVCQAITAVMPRVIIAEYNASFPPPIEWVKPYDPAYIWDGSMYFGASLAAYAQMLAKKGFTLVGTDLCGGNSFFVRNDLVGDLFVDAGNVHSLYNPPRYALRAGYPSGHPPVFAKFTNGAFAG